MKLTNGTGTGGLGVIRPRPLLMNEPQKLYLLSDLHLGANNCDEQKIHDELSSLDPNTRILIGGDIYDGVLPGDKRFNISRLHPRFLGRNDLLDAVVEWSIKFLSPWADQIDVIGVGNHETAVENKTSSDPIKRLMSGLCGGGMNYGGYSSLIEYRFVARGETPRRDARRDKTFVIWFHHGAGKVSSSLKALQVLQGASSWIDADVYWNGHSHARCHVEEARLICPRSGDEPTTRPVHYIVTGGYLNTYSGQTQKSVRRNGRLSNYAADAGLKPHGKGGTLLTLQWNSREQAPRVSVEQ